MISIEYNLLDPYRKVNQRAYARIHSHFNYWHYREYINQEIPFYTGIITTDTAATFNIDVYRANWSPQGSISLSFYCLIYKNGDKSKSYFVEVRYNYQDIIIRKEKLYHWIPKLFWYKTNSDFGFTNVDNHPLISESELLELMEQCLELHRDLDYRFLNFDNVKCPPLASLYTKKSSFHYLIQCETTNTIKIGRAATPLKRFSQIDSDTATKIRLIATIQNDYAIVVDELLKQHFIHKCYKKEWFSLTKADVDRILSKNLPYPINQFLGQVDLYNPLLSIDTPTSQKV
ncbi:GIY-YIG nuclease family protein [Peribacillus sp. NPDC097206]|uniref:GIY-YIG nuclease family protein n=1 Tax=Peribacillus sp. NPDC097206 TaxID=3364398 RepID=UPI003817A7FE